MSAGTSATVQTYGLVAVFLDITKKLNNHRPGDKLFENSCFFYISQSLLSILPFSSKITLFFFHFNFSSFFERSFRFILYDGGRTRVKLSLENVILAAEYLLLLSSQYCYR